jgi:hypothetical protein
MCENGEPISDLGNNRKEPSKELRQRAHNLLLSSAAEKYHSPRLLLLEVQPEF